jgi:hypothetical protein
MKKLIGLVLIISMFSCRKEYPYPSNDYTTSTPATPKPSISMWGEFLVLDAKMYMDNHETGMKMVYDHFGPNRQVSSLRYDGSLFDIETIVQGVTTYSFYKPVSGNIGVFLLNEDSTRVYGLNVTSSFTSIVENPTSGVQLMGGSARPFSGWTVDYANKIIVIHIEEIEASVGGYNTSYFTEIRLKKIREF